MGGESGVTTGIFETAAEKEARERTEGESRKKREDRLQFRFNFLLTVCAVISAIFVFYQVRIMNRTLDLASRQTEAAEKAVRVASDTLSAMKAQSEASDRAARENAVAENSRAQRSMDQSAAQNRATLQMTGTQMRVDLRAWVGFVSDTISFVGGRRLTHGILLTNSGKTPALNVRMLTGPQVVLKGGKFSPVYGDRMAIGPGGGSSSTIPPAGNKQLFAATIDFDPAALDQIRNGTITVYQFGEVTYDDVFGRSHQTTFCVFVLPSLAGTGDCPEYNNSR